MEPAHLVVSRAPSLRVLGPAVVRYFLLSTALQLTPATQHIPGVVCSAATHQSRSLADYLTERGVETLLKPFDLVDLYRVVDGLTRRLRLLDTLLAVVDQYCLQAKQRGAP
jgi:hypothetical protein